MKQVKLPAWLQHFVAVMGGRRNFCRGVSGFFGAFVSVYHRRAGDEDVHRTAGADALLRGDGHAGLALGCIWIYWLAKKGGEVYFHRHGGRYALKAKRWVDDHAFLSLFIPAILPPPMQFKVFVLAEGVFQVPLRTFVLALVLGRGLRYVAEGIFAVKYGQGALVYLVVTRVCLY